MTITVEQPGLLLVEGKDEERFFSALFRHRHLAGIQVLGIAGKANLRPNLKALVLTPDFKRVIRLGIIRDADGDPQAAFQSVRNAVTAVGLTDPLTTSKGYGASPTVAVLLLPDAGTGALEDVCLQAVSTDPVMQCVEAFLGCTAALVGAPRHPGKAKVQAFLASRPEEGKRLGEAAEAGYWPWEAEAFGILMDFVQHIATGWG